MAPDGTVLMLYDKVVFRSVKPEQIQMAIAMQGTPEESVGHFCDAARASVYAKATVSA